MTHPTDDTVARAAGITARGYEIGPRLDPCECGAPRHAHRGARHLGAHPPTGCRRYHHDPADALAQAALAAARNSLQSDLAEYERRERARRKARAPGALGIGPSDTTSCARAIQYRERPDPAMVTNPEDKRAARLGTLLHAGAVRARSKLYPWRLFEQDVEIPGLDRPGRYDEYDPVLAVLRDLKTAGSWKWDHIAEDGPPEEEWDQAQIYALGLALQGKPVREVRIAYLQRAGGVDEEFSRPYDEAAANRALSRLLGYATAIDLGQELPRSRSGPSTDPLCRSHCQFRDHCWNLPAARDAGRSPESYTLVVTDEDAVWAVARRAAAARAEREAKVAAEQAKALIAGLDEGRYGDYYLRHASRQMPDYKRQVELLRTYYDLDPAERPRLESIPEVKRRDSWDDVRPVRAAQREREARTATETTCP